GELAVAEIGFVHDLGDDPEPPVLEAEALQERFERAVLAVMPELGAEDVEGDPLLGSVGRVRESESRVRVDEAFDEPRGRNAVDVRWPSGPAGPGPRGRPASATDIRPRALCERAPSAAHHSSCRSGRRASASLRPGTTGSPGRATGRARSSLASPAGSRPRPSA